MPLQNLSDRFANATIINVPFEPASTLAMHYEEGFTLIVFTYYDLTIGNGHAATDFDVRNGTLGSHRKTFALYLLLLL